jgi:hypothetical protein
VQNFTLPNTVDTWASEGVAQTIAKKLYGVPFTTGNYQTAMNRGEAAALIDLAVKQVRAIQNTAKTPDGMYVIEGQEQATQWKAVDLRIGHQMDSPDYVSTPNHSSIVKKEEVLIPVGKATLLTFAQDNFTAVTEQQPGAKTDTVYWLYVTKPIPNNPKLVDTYVLSGVVTGDAAEAKAELLEVAKTWNPPIN